MSATLWDYFREVGRTVRVADILDVLVIAVAIYAAISWFRQSRSRLVMSGLATLAVLYFAAGLLDMHLTLALFHAGITVAAVTLVVIFQDELRRAFERMALAGRLRSVAQHHTPDTVVDTVVEAMESLARDKVGALVVFRGREPLERHLTGGISLDGRVSEPLLFSIFDTSSAGHDGAVVIQSGVITHFAAHLPLSVEIRGDERFGTRHTAALGLSERCDALVVVVSEERGVVSVAQNGRLTEVQSGAELRRRIGDFFERVAPEAHVGLLRRWFGSNLGLKALSGTIAIAAWLVALGYRSETALRSLDIPVVFNDVPSGWVVKNLEPLELRVSLSGPQSVLERLHDKLTVAIHPAKLRSGAQQVPVTAKDISLPSGVVVRDIEPKTIQFTAERTVTKNVIVQADTKGYVPSGVILRALTVTPKQVQIVVPRSRAGVVRHVLTEPIFLNEITDVTTLKQPLVIPTGVTLAPGEPTTVDVHVDVVPKGR